MIQIRLEVDKENEREHNEREEDERNRCTNEIDTDNNKD